MRKILLLSALLLCAVSMMAVPAHPGTVKVTQPDGTQLTLRLVGDEWLHFTTTEDGYSVVKDQRGYYVYAELQDGLLKPTAQVAHDAAMRQAAELAYVKNLKKYQAPQMTEKMGNAKRKVQKRQQQTLAARRAAQYDYNNFKGLIVLVQYQDKEFSRDDFHDYVYDMVNQENYTGYRKTNGQFVSCTGSVRDYFSDNSDGKFQPQFDVVGPYTVNYSQYDGGSSSAEIIISALDQADTDVDFSQYDGDGDGYVDLVFFILAGNGANYSGNDGRLWWPHRSIIYKPDSWDWMVQKDGVVLYDYASSVELAGYTSWPSSIKLDGIGTICHEFSHVLGLPDFYDTNYEEGGQSNDPGIWSVMSGGSYENDSHTPVGYSLYERYSVGFIDEPQVISEEGTYTLNPLHSGLTGFRIDSQQENEFFLFENRQKNDFKWDAYLPGSGMLVHRVDFTNQSVWEDNTINANPSHNYYEVIRAGGSSHSGTNWDLFPGKGNKHELHSTTSPANLKSWAGKNTKWGLTNINMDSEGVVTFDIINTFILLDLSLPESATAQIGLPIQLTATLVPDYVDSPLTWTSDDETVATVDQDGVVTGVGEGSCNITVTADNGMTASCVVTIEALTAVDVATFKAEEVGTQKLLQLTDAEVLYVNKKVVYVRDATGPVVFNNIGFTLKKNQVLNGTLLAEVGMTNNMVEVTPISGLTNADDLTIVDGEDVLPREVKLEELTADDYGDYVFVKDFTMETDNGYWAVSEGQRARLWNQFRISGLKIPNDFEGKTYQVEAIFGTENMSGTIVDELYLLSSITEVEVVPDPDPDPDPDVTGIDGIAADKAAGIYYDLQGRRVAPDTKGVLIHNGRKVFVK